VAEHYFSSRPTSRPEIGLLKCHLRGLYLEFLTSTGVFSHRRIDNGTMLLIDSMELPDSGSALDMGCGYGAVGIVAAVLKPSLDVWMTDVNSRATKLAQENALRNHAGNVHVVKGSLYEPVRDLNFDVILTNPPFTAGMDRVVEPIIEGSTGHLRSGGSLQLVVRTNKGGNQVAQLMKQYYGDFDILARRSGYRVLRATKG